MRHLMLALTLLALAAPAARAGITRLSDGEKGQGDGASAYASISGDGRYVVFDSFAQNLDPYRHGNGGLRIYMTDRVTGKVKMVSTSRGSDAANGFSEWPVISENGRYVSFYTEAQNLHACPCSNQEVVRKDLVTGEVKAANVTSDGRASNANDYYAEVQSSAISADGRFVAFIEEGSLVPDDTSDRYMENGWMDVYLHDFVTGETIRVSETADGAEIPSGSRMTGMSPDGRYIGFDTSGKVLPDVPASIRRGYVYDRITGEITVPVRDLSGGPGTGHVTDWSADNRYLLISSFADDLVPGSTPYARWTAYVLDSQTGKLTRVANGMDGSPPNADVWPAAISADGTRVSFSSTADNLVANDLNLTSDVFVKDLTTGVTTMVSKSLPVNQGHSAGGAMSADGRTVAFQSSSALLVPPDLNNREDVFAATS